MKKVILVLEDYVYDFYKKVGENAGKATTEEVIADALFKLAGELSLDALNNQKSFM